MGSVRVRKETGTLLLDFFYRGVRCREQTRLENTTENQQRLKELLKRIESEIEAGDFVYADYFPGSSNNSKIQSLDSGIAPECSGKSQNSGPLFMEFCEDWYVENEISWKLSYRKTIRGTLDNYLIPEFGEKEVGSITKSEILKFRSSLAKVRIGKKEGLSPDRINHIMTPLRMILNEAADRYEFNTPFIRIKPLKVPPTDVDPFTIDEVMAILGAVRNDFRNYYVVRFFTALRTGEIDGLKWKYVDFERRLIRVRETLVDGQEDTTKTPGSIRDIWMSTPVLEAMKKQWEDTGKHGDFVFCNKEGLPLDHRNITKRIWYPLLRFLELKPRRPYQTRHTAATLWLAAGENPEWIARQMGHTSTRMLFTVYSRFVPNLTRQDGSAFERLMSTAMKGADNE